MRHCLGHGYCVLAVFTYTLCDQQVVSFRINSALLLDPQANVLPNELSLLVLNKGVNVNIIPDLDPSFPPLKGLSDC